MRVKRSSLVKASFVLGVLAVCSPKLLAQVANESELGTGPATNTQTPVPRPAQPRPEAGSSTKKHSGAGSNAAAAIVGSESAPRPELPGAARSVVPAKEFAAIQTALNRVFPMPFAKPTSLESVRKHLQETLGLPVVLDRAALDRQEVRPEDTVQLELEGVRLKTSLQLLLDQVSLTFRVVPDDNLLILTDSEGAEDPLTRISAEIRELHRDLHELQDTVDELTSLLIPEGLDLRMRKPTIVEEMPDAAGSGNPDGSPQPNPPGNNTQPSGPSTIPAPKPGERLKRPIPGAAPDPNQAPSGEPSPSGRTPLGRSRKRI